MSSFAKRRTHAVDTIESYAEFALTAGCLRGRPDFFLSPCVLPLVPGYVSLISGVGVEQLKMKEGDLFRKVMLNSAAFIVGFSIVFITLGAISTEVGQVLAQYKTLLARIAGAVIILFGLHLTGLLQIKALLADTRLHNLKGSSSAWGAFVIGFAFAFGWTPCVGPILAVVLGFAAAQDTVWKGSSFSPSIPPDWPCPSF